MSPFLTLRVGFFLYNILTNFERGNPMNTQFLYDPKPTILTKTEREFMAAINKTLPGNCILLVQQNLGAIVERTDNSRFRNELFRIVDIFCDFNLFRKPCKVILDRFVRFLNRKGFKNDKYED